MKLGEASLLLSSLSPEEENYLLLAGDNGVGLLENLDWRNTETLRMQLVLLLVQQLGGEIELDAARGMTYKITFRETR